MENIGIKNDYEREEKMEDWKRTSDNWRQNVKRKIMERKRR